MKIFDEMWQEYLDLDGLTAKTFKELAWHIDHDEDPTEAITLATDMGLVKLAPNIARHLDHEDDWIRELSVGCLLGRLALPEYAEKGLQMAQEDPARNVRGLAIFDIGAVLNKIDDRSLQKKIAQYLDQIIRAPAVPDIVAYSDLSSHKGEAYRSMLAALEIPNAERPRVRDLEKSIQLEMVEKFRKKFNLDKPTVAKS